MSTLVDRIFGQRIRGVRVVPLVLKIVVIFTVLLLVSNFVSNYINLMLNRGQLLKLTNQLLVKDLTELSIFASNQHQIYTFNNDLQGAVKSIEASAMKGLQRQRSVAIGVKPDGSIFFQASKTVHVSEFTDQAALQKMLKARDSSAPEGSLLFSLNGKDYIGVFKYSEQWKVFIIRAEELNEFYQDSWNIFWTTSIIIVVITLVCAVLGVFLIRYMLRFVRVITQGIMNMQKKQTMDIIDLKGAPNDDITFLGVALNSTTSTIDNLMDIFRKFVTTDLVQKAYREREIRLEGAQRDLAVLFTDIRSFTYMTEALGNDVIKLLNLHYDQAIHYIQENGGVVGSIIGDALLSVFGTLEGYGSNKSYMAVKSAYQVQDVAAALREDMTKRREEIVKRHGALSATDERVYRAVLLEVGVGIDGGEVFYGTIGSHERMTNTVIGDNVNSASRLEGLTRFYKVPVVVSEYVKDEVERDYADYVFMEIDRVQVKGKTLGKRIYWPISKKNMDEELDKDVKLFNEGLSLYYEGQWPAAYKSFAKCSLPVADIFRDRTKNNTSPKGWDGVWAMTMK